jgi:2,4-dienoyl-CoA reductase-like NADH-dependent reductase (Old Yellow Enzyme family)
MDLFTAISIKGKKIRNRIVLPPMVCFGWAGDNGLVTNRHLTHYQKIAQGGCGLIILEAHAVNRDGRLGNSQLGIWADEYIPGLTQLVEVCHDNGAKVLVQIHHAGFKTPAVISPNPVSASDYIIEKIRARALTLGEIRQIEHDYIAASMRAEQAGADGIEIHGAHGFLVSQFMSPLTNQRNDEYGGVLENRARFAVEIINEIRNHTNSDFIIGYRMGGNEPALDEGIEIARVLEIAGVDLLHVSAGIQGQFLPRPPAGFPYNWIVYCGTEIKKQVRIPVIVVNGIRTPAPADNLIKNQLADFTAIGKGQLADPWWANHAKEGSEIISCLECPECSWYTDGRKCPRYD